MIAPEYEYVRMLHAQIGPLDLVCIYSGWGAPCSVADSSIDPSVSLMVPIVGAKTHEPSAFWYGGTRAGVSTEHVAFLHDLVALDPLSMLSAENSSHLYRNGLRLKLAFFVVNS